MYQSLSTLQEGEMGRVASITSTGPMRRRLQDLGVVEGTPILCLQKSPFGDPVAYLIRGAVIALRREDARGILVSPPQECL